MGITRSYNKNNGVYYAYETSYEWSDEKQKKVQRKRCIGQFVPGTDEIIPNGPRGKKGQGGTIRQDLAEKVSTPKDANSDQYFADLRTKLEVFERSLADLSAATRDIVHELATYPGVKDSD